MSRHLKSIVQSLYYPAVLGAAFVLFLQKISQISSVGEIMDGSYIFAFGLVVYCTASYLINEEIDIYSGITFTIDCIEIALVFFCFYYLGFIDTQYSNITAFYICIATLPFISVLWNISNGYFDYRLSILAVIVSLVSLTSAIVHTQFKIFNVISAGILVVLLLYYVTYLIRDQ